MCKKAFTHLPLVYLCAIICFVLLHIALNAQEADTWLKPLFTTYQEQRMQEKMYVHTDKNFYLAGEICWFKIYNTDIFFHRPLGISKLAYVELLDKDNKAVLRTKVSLLEGSGNGSLQWPATLPSWNYLLRAYTNWMKNFDANWFFQKKLTIINTRKIYEAVLPKQPSRYDIQFFPEGGNLVNGMQSRIAFRMVGDDGKGLNCSGFVLNDKADTLAVYHTLKFGMGSFLFTPVQGQLYKAVTVLPNGTQVIQALPVADNNGYVLHLVRSNANQITVMVQCAAENAATIYLFVHTRGLVKIMASSKPQNGLATFLVDNDKLGDGISHFTIFNAARQPVCERLFFKKPAQPFNLAVSTSQSTYEPRKKVTVQVSAKKSVATERSADMSMAVYRIDSLIQPDDMNISNYLWLNGDLVGNIESPEYYFSSETAEVEEASDNLVLTQGWRRFRWNDILRNTKPVFEFAPEFKGHFIKGKVINNVSGQPVKGAESFLSVAGTRTQFRDAISNDSGAVQFEMKDFYGNNEIIVQSPNRDEVQKHIEITGAFSDKVSQDALPVFTLPEKNETTLFNQNIAFQVENTYSGEKQQRFSLPVFDSLPFYSKPDKTYILDDYVRFTTVEEVLREYVPDVNVRKTDGKFNLPVFDNIRKEFFKAEPLLLLDGVPVMDADKIMQYDPLKIRKLDVVARMYFYGNMFFDGIVNFITYQGNLPGFELDPHATVIDYETLQSQREFFSPQYEAAVPVSGRLPDFRTLLYWSPVVKTDNKGKQAIDFYASDLPGHYAVVIQGLTADGKTGSSTVFFDVKELASVSSK